MLIAQEPFRSSDLIRTSLILSGIPERDLESYTSQLENYLAEVRSTLQPRTSSEYELGRALLVYLHETRLKRYDSSQSAIHTLIKKGKFNCLSSAVLYLICARSLGLTVEPVDTGNHVLFRLKYGENWIDVETTTKFGFHPGSRNEFVNSFGRVTTSTSVRSKNYRKRKKISELQLLSLLLRERLRDKDPEMLRVAIDWYILTPTEDSRYLEYAFRNYVSWLNKKDLHDQAITFVRQYKKRFEWDHVHRKSVQTLLHNQIWVFIKEKKFDLAEQLLDESRGVITADVTRGLAESLLAKAMRESKRSKHYDALLNLTARLVANGHLPKSTSEDYVNYFNGQKKQAQGRRK
jgi:regulator of sirC expression with transglutaminase-like and TPR domain